LDSWNEAPPIGCLIFHRGLWLGRYQDPRLGAAVELLVGGDATGPNGSEIATIETFLARFEENVLNFRRRLVIGWSYYPIRISVNQAGSLGVQFQSFLPFLGRKMVQDNGTVF
jgi:hypothetical protein